MDLGSDLRYAWHQLRHHPRFALAALLTLGLGIGATATMFSVLDQVVLRPLPYAHPAQLVTIAESEYSQPASGDGGGTSLPNAEEWQTRAHTLSSVGYYTYAVPVVTGVAHPQSVPELLFSTNVFDLFGVTPALGRGFTPSDASPGAPPVVVLGASQWRTLFNSDPHVLGRVISLNGAPSTIIGVMPERFPFQGGDDFLLAPLNIHAKELQDRSSGVLNVIARLRSGSTVEDARRELAGIKQQDLKTYPGKERDVRIDVERYQHALTRKVAPGLLLLHWLVVAVWLLATVNVAGLLLTRTEGRRREIAVRAALGAGSGRLLRQFLIESLLLSLLGGAAGLAFTAISLHVSRAYLATSFLNGDLIHIDGTVLIYVLVASCLSALLFGMAPALQAARLPIQDGLREGTAGGGSTRRRMRMRDAIVTVEVALSLLLLVAAGVMARTLYDLERTPLGFEPDHLVTAELMLPQKGFWFLASGRTQGANIVTTLVDPMLTRLRALPGVSAVGVTTVRPLHPNWSFRNQVRFAGRPRSDEQHAQSADVRAASPDYFRAMGVSLVAGRLFNATDTPTAPIAVIVNQAFTRQIAGARSPLGMRLLVGEAGPREYATIVGVVDDAVQSIGDPVKPEMLIDFDQMSPEDDLYPILVAFRLDLAVRSAADPSSLIPAITRIVQEANPNIAVNHAELMRTSVTNTIGSQTLAARLLGIFAIVALLIAAAGLYSLLAYQVVQQQRDLGLRLALGAQRKDVLWLVLRRAVVLLTFGGLLGIAASYTFSHLARHQLATVDLHDLTLVVELVTLLLAAACLAASYLPARRAAHIDPMQALRHE